MFDRVYTVGCFDYLHVGHEILFQRLRESGKEVIVGIHDDASIELLKKLKPHEHENLEIRVAKIKKFCDSVFIVSDKDPSLYLKAIIRDYDNKENACFIRGDDMPNFPGKRIVEEKMSIKYVPYTQGISSTEIRKNKASQ
jgi:cytidyltransferase-like protein